MNAMKQLTKEELRDLKKCSKTRLIKNAQDYRAKAWEIKSQLDITSAQLQQMLEIERILQAEIENFKKETRKLTYKNQQLKNVVKSLAGCL